MGEISGSGPAPTPSPTWAPTPTPTPTPTPGKTWDGEPPCLSDEQAAQISDQSGTALDVVCTAPCDASGNCPTDTPAGMNNPKPACAIQDQAGDMFCALECGILGRGDCPSGASCSDNISGGICTYPSTTFATAMSVKADVIV